ncbi:MAG TPA: hypothetical protein VFB22_03750 [Candidatus Baltobacteraceae bacterium]|nr:hypothetical protein [Candidatus Baltobacteraceae bacterium]
MGLDLLVGVLAAAFLTLLGTGGLNPETERPRRAPQRPFTLVRIPSDDDADAQVWPLGWN